VIPVLHRLVCRMGQHLWRENFRYGPQGFASVVYKVQDICCCCQLQRWREIPYANPFASPQEQETD